MPEVLKVGVIYRDRNPRIISDISDEVLETMPWNFEFFEEGSILERPFAPQNDIFAVFFPHSNQIPQMNRQLAGMFPAAEMIAYRQGDGTASDAAAEDGVPVVELPMPFVLARHILSSSARLSDRRREGSTLRRRFRDLDEFFGAFVDMVEASWVYTDRKASVNHLLGRIAARLQADECSFYLSTEAGRTLQRGYCTGNIKDLDLFDHQANGAVVENVLKGGVALLDNEFQFEIKSPFTGDKTMIRSLLCMPIERHGEKIGVLEILNKQQGGFNQGDLDFIRMIAGPVAVAVGTVRMLDNSERLTIIDDLTKLYNYRYLMQYLEAEVKRCLRYKKKVSLLFIDVDGFKRINDTFGHLVGSLALSEMGQMLRRILRETDVIGRYGGDEFVVVLPETPLNGALVIAERIRKKVEDYEFIAHDLSIHLTVSLGVANCPKHTLTAEGLIKKADAAMYRAKELSKNSIKVAV